MILVAIATKFESSKIPLLSSNSLQSFKQIIQQSSEILHFSFFSFSYSIGSVMSYLSKNDAENLQNGKVHLAQIPEFEMKYIENHLGTLRLVIAHCIAFFTLSFKLNFFSTGFPFNCPCYAKY